jgi:hypothetical protein
MGETSKLGWLITLVKHATWVNFLHFLYQLLLSISKILAYPSLLYDLLHRHVGLILTYIDPLWDCVYVHGATWLAVQNPVIHHIPLLEPLIICSNVLTVWWLSSSGRWRRVALIRTDVSEDRIASIFRVNECEHIQSEIVSSCIGGDSRIPRSVSARTRSPWRWRRYDPPKRRFL